MSLIYRLLQDLCSQLGAFCSEPFRHGSFSCFASHVRYINFCNLMLSEPFGQIHSFGATLVHAGAILGNLGPILGSCWLGHLRAMSGHLGAPRAIFGLSWDPCGQFSAIVDLILGQLGSSWSLDHLEAFRGYLGTLLAHVGALLGPS